MKPSSELLQAFEEVGLKLSLPANANESPGEPKNEEQTWMESMINDERPAQEECFPSSGSNDKIPLNEGFIYDVEAEHRWTDGHIRRLLDG